MQKRKDFFSKNIALSQIFLLVIGTLSFSFIISQSNIVSGQNNPEPPIGGDTDSDDFVNAFTGGDSDGFFAEFDEGSATIQSAEPPTKLTGTPPPPPQGAINPTGNTLKGYSGNPSDPNFVGPPAPDPKTTDPKPGASGLGGLVSTVFSGSYCGAFASLCAGAVWGLTLAAVGGLVADFFGANDATKDALTKAIFIGSVAGGLAANAVTAFGTPTVAQGVTTYSTNALLGVKLSSFQVGAIVGIAVAAVVFIALYKDESKKVVQFQCLPFEPQLGGEQCSQCNNDPFRPCSEYRCKSLGQACDLVNKGTEEESCVWISRDDVTSPTITPAANDLTEGHRFVSHSSRPPALGTRIVRDGVANGCVKAFTPLQFGITTNEPAQCKIETAHTDSYEEMTYFFGETNYYLHNHTQIMSLPSPDAINSAAPELVNDGKYDLYVRCQDANGNVNEDEFVITFCVDPSPDTTPPVIVDTSITSGSPVAFDSDEVPLSIYVNEPAECKWSIDDKNYEDMENTMSCSTNVEEINAKLLYTCSTTLSGVEDRTENNYYFRCKDKPNKDDSERNVNTQSFPFSLRGSQELAILSVSPEEGETLTGSTSAVTLDLQVETSAGSDEGKSICFFSPDGSEGSYVTMFNTNSFAHSQTLTLTGGEYEYFFRCVDAGGNSDEAQTSFTVDVDSAAPRVTRAYRELDALKIVTNEDAECVYSLNSCNYNVEEGISMIYSNPDEKMNHFLPWEESKTYYIKCVDDFGNQPSPDQCSLTASAVNIN